MMDDDSQQRRRRFFVVILTIINVYLLMRRSNEAVIEEILNERGGSAGRKRKLFPDSRNEYMNERCNYVVSSYNSCSEDEWRRRFRVSRRLFLKLVKDLTPALGLKRSKLQRHDTVREAELIGIALRRLGTRGEIDNVAELVGRSSDCVRQCTDKFCAAVVTAYFKEVIRLPTAAETNALCQKMFTERGLPQCWGAIDGKHWLHTQGGAEFSCYKHANGKSITGLAVADSNYMCRWLGNFYCGTAGDGRLWNESHLKKQLQRRLWPPASFVQTKMTVAGVQVYPYIAGDAAFMLTEYMIRTENSTRLVEKVFNGGRQVVEQMWGQILNRFRCFQSSGGVER